MGSLFLHRPTGTGANTKDEGRKSKSAALKQKGKKIGCSHSTPIPSDREIALSKPTKTSTFLLEQHQKLGFSMDEIPMQKTSEEKIPFIDVFLTEEVNFFDDQKAVTILKFRIGKHFPGYASFLLDTQDNVVAYMLPLHRPGRPIPSRSIPSAQLSMARNQARTKPSAKSKQSSTHGLHFVFADGTTEMSITRLSITKRMVSCVWPTMLIGLGKSGIHGQSS